MGIWKLPKTKSEAEALTDVMSRELRADTASDELYSILGCDDLFDRIAASRKAMPGADVRSLVVNSITEIYFTGQEATAIASEEALTVLEELVDTRFEDKSDIFFLISKACSAAEAVAHAAWALEIKTPDIKDWSVVRDSQNLDFIARGPSGDLYRINATDGVTTTIHETNHARYEGLFGPGPASKL